MMLVNLYSSPRIAVAKNRILYLGTQIKEKKKKGKKSIFGIF